MLTVTKSGFVFTEGNVTYGSGKKSQKIFWPKNHFSQIFGKFSKITVMKIAVMKFPLTDIQSLPN